MGGAFDDVGDGGGGGDGGDDGYLPDWNSGGGGDSGSKEVALGFKQ